MQDTGIKRARHIFQGHPRSRYTRSRLCSFSPGTLGKLLDSRHLKIRRQQRLIGDAQLPDRSPADTIVVGSERVKHSNHKWRLTTASRASRKFWNFSNFQFLASYLPILGMWAELCDSHVCAALASGTYGHTLIIAELVPRETVPLRRHIRYATSILSRLVSGREMNMA